MHMINTDRLTGSKHPEPSRWLFFAPPQFEQLPVTHRDHFLFLDDKSTKIVYEMANHIELLCGDDGWGNSPFSGGCYKDVIHYDITGNIALVKKWLYRCGLPFSSEVFLLPVFKAESTPAVLTTWKMVIKYIDPLFTGDNLIIIPHHLRWCLYYHHDDKIYFAKNRRNNQ